MTTVAPSGSVDQELILDLGCLGARSLPMVGGKAANLGELIRAGFPVPPGFCVTTTAYQQVATDLGADVDEPQQDDTTLAGWARARILAAPVPAGIADAVDRAYRALGEGVPVAVRSSATAEDLPWRASPGSRTPSSTSWARTRCSTRCAGAGPRCGPTGRSATETPTASITPE